MNVVMLYEKAELLMWRMQEPVESNAPGSWPSRPSEPLVSMDISVPRNRAARGCCSLHSRRQRHGLLLFGPLGLFLFLRPFGHFIASASFPLAHSCSLHVPGWKCPLLLVGLGEDPALQIRALVWCSRSICLIYRYLLFKVFI